MRPSITFVIILISPVLACGQQSFADNAPIEALPESFWKAVGSLEENGDNDLPLREIANHVDKIRIASGARPLTPNDAVPKNIVIYTRSHRLDSATNKFIIALADIEIARLENSVVISTCASKFRWIINSTVISYALIQCVDVQYYEECGKPPPEKPHSVLVSGSTINALMAESATFIARDVVRIGGSRGCSAQGAKWIAIGTEHDQHSVERLRITKWRFGQNPSQLHRSIYFEYEDQDEMLLVGPSKDSAIESHKGGTLKIADLKNRQPREWKISGASPHVLVLSSNREVSIQLQTTSH